MKTELNRAIGKRVRVQREKLHLSREELSEQIEVSSRFLADIELGAKGMSFQTLIRLSKELHVSTDYILLGETKDSNNEVIAEMIRHLDDDYLPELEAIICSYTKAIEKKSLRSK